MNNPDPLTVLVESMRHNTFDNPNSGFCLIVAFSQY
jgi:hypothetical protein